MDESGLSTRPTGPRTCGSRGQPPEVQETVNWKSLSVIDELPLLRFCFQINARSIMDLQEVQFLRHLQRLPAHAPQINPTEHMWGRFKTSEIANLIAKHA